MKLKYGFIGDGNTSKHFQAYFSALQIPFAVWSPSKRVYYLRENDKIGNSNGYVAKIREGEIIVVETVTTDDGRMVQQTRILKISKQPPASN